jgi:NADH-quinone oxidoreductase subunit M
VFLPLVLATLWMGVYPQSFLDVFEASVAALVQRHEAAMGASRLAGL